MMFHCVQIWMLNIWTMWAEAHCTENQRVKDFTSLTLLKRL